MTALCSEVSTDGNKLCSDKSFVLVVSAWWQWNGWQMTSLADVTLLWMGKVRIWWRGDNNYWSLIKWKILAGRTKSNNYFHGLLIYWLLPLPSDFARGWGGGVVKRLVLFEQWPETRRRSVPKHWRHHSHFTHQTPDILLNKWFSVIDW